MLRRFRPIAPVAVLAVGWLPATGCSCGQVECNAASVAVDVPARSSAESVNVCINDVCAIASDTISYGTTWVERYFDDPAMGVRDDEDFELSITVLDSDGNALASMVETRNFDVDPCRCLSFPYRWTGTEIERAD